MINFADGQLKRKTDAAGLWAEHLYDAAHRLSRKTLSTGEMIDYCYDGKVYTGSGCGDLSGRSSDGLDYPKGRLTGVGSAGGWTNHLQVDALGRTLKVEQKAADLAVQTLEYSYATNGFVKTLKYPSGRVVSYAQSNAGRTLSATGSGAGEQYASGLTYGANGALLGAVWNGTGATRLVESRSYNWLGQMRVAEVKKGGTELKWKITNEYGDLNNNGNLNKQWTQTGTATYGVRFAYDAANRIRGAAEDAPGEGSLATASCSTVGGTWCVKYRADGFGNLWTENKSETAAGVAALSEAAYDAATNRLTAAGYYANGNQKHWVLNEAKSRAEYDADGKMVRAGRVTENEGTVWDAAQALTTLTYNGAGQRVKKTVTQGAATQTVHYVYGLDGEVAAEWESAPTGLAGRQYLVGDHLGSTRVRLDANGEVLQRIDYEPFGTEVQRTGVSGYGGGNAVRQKFTGKERDGETGLDWFKTRYLSAAQGRFTSPDKPFNDQFPEDPQSWNLYTYVRNNPLKMVDEDGESATVVGGIGGALIGGAVAAWRGESVWKGAVSGAVAGALAGAVIDTGGVALGVYGAAAAGSALGGVGGGIVGRSLNGQETTVQDVAIDAGLGVAGGVVGAAAGKAVVAVGQRIAGPSAAFETLRPGPYASESIPATGPRVTPAQAQQLRGQPCHTCGTGSPGTRSGNPVGDHQPSTGLAVRGGSQQLYPHCTSCSGRQGSQVRQQNQTWRGQQRTGGQAGAGAGTAGTRRPEDEHN